MCETCQCDLSAIIDSLALGADYGIWLFIEQY